MARKIAIFRLPFFLVRLAVAFLVLAAPAGAQLIFMDGFESGDTSAWAVPCLPAGSMTIQFLSPGRPALYGGGLPEFDIFNNVRDNEPADPGLAGTFELVPPPSPQPELECSISGGPAADCSDLSYEIGTLNEIVAGYLVTVGESCVGVPATETLRIFVDQNPPVLVGSPQVLVDGENATAQVSFTVADAITNIEAIDCLLDFDANGLNPDLTDVGSVEFVDCSWFGLTFSPTRPEGSEDSPRGPRQFSGALQLTELSAGRHRLWLRFTDFWGHSTVASGPVEFLLDATDESAGQFGHVVAIGHDYLEADVDLERLIGNSVLLSSASSFSRPLRISTLDLGNAHPQEMATALDAIELRLAALGEPPPEIHPWSGGAGELVGRLLGRDVLLIYDQNDPSSSRTLGANLEWLFTLRTFVEAGGVIVVLDGLVDGSLSSLSQTVGIVGWSEAWNEPGAPPEADPLDEDTNLLDSLALAGVSGVDPIELVCRSTHSIAGDVGTGPEPRSYAPSNNTVVLLRDPVANELFVAPWLGAYHPVVLDRRYPRREMEGPVRVVASGLESENVVHRGGDSWAVFSAASGELHGACRLQGDGTATRDVAPGDTVTIASVSPASPGLETGRTSEGGTPFGGRLDLESVFAVELWETIEVGRTSEPPVEVPGQILVQMPPFNSAFTDLEYLLTNGCESTSELFFPGDSPVLSLPGPPTDECLAGGEMSFLAAVLNRDDNSVLAYASLEHHPPMASGVCHLTPGFSGWCVEFSDWPTPGGDFWVTPQTAPLVSYVGPALDPLPELELAQLLLRASASEIAFEEGLGGLPALQSYYAPKVPNAFADVLRVHGLIYSGLEVGTGFSLSTRAKDIALEAGGLPGGETTQQLPRAEFLSRILGLDIDGTQIAQPLVSWTLAPGASLASAQGGIGDIGYAAGTACADPRCGAGCDLFFWDGSWSFVLPAEAATVRLPVLPGELGCFLPTADLEPGSLAFVSIDVGPPALTFDEFRRSAWGLFDAHFNSLRTHAGDAGGITRMTSYCGVQFCAADSTPDSPPADGRLALGCYIPEALEIFLCD